MAASKLPRRGLPTATDLAAMLAGLVIAVPIAAMILVGIMDGGGENWKHISEVLLPGYASNTLLVLVLTGVLILCLAVPAAWLVTMYDFPGRGAFEWLLILPLAAPGYVFAYAYADLLGVGGPLQSALRDATGLAARDYWFPNISSLPGLALVLGLTLYPYVYLTARAGFTSQSVCALEAARSLGSNARERFWRVALPAARPAIAAGLALALMEAAADYGAAEYLGVPTLTFGIVRAWGSFNEPGVAARLAFVLLSLIVILTLVERWSRGRAGSQQSSTRWRTLSRSRLSGPAKWLATGLCTFIILVSFAMPVGRLIWLSLETQDAIAPVTDALRNSVTLAAIGTVFAFVLAVIIAVGIRQLGPGGKIARVFASAGYAVPGAVLALGGLAVLASFNLPLGGAAALFILVWVYSSRFTAAGAEPMQAALARAPQSLGHAARSLGASPMRQALKVDLPLALPGAAVGALILFVEILKELPATLMLRPMNWDTLSVRAYAYASDERLSAAALPALLITLAGLLPVLILSWQLSRSRPGDVR